MKKFIESVKRYSCWQTQLTTNAAPQRTRVHIVDVEYSDGSENTFQVEGQCKAYLDTGFLVASGRKWIFYNVSGEKVAEIAKVELGRKVKIISTGDYAFYSDEEEIPVAVNAKGEKIPYPQRCIGFPADQQFTHITKWSVLKDRIFTTPVDVQ